MQTFLPYANYRRSARALDSRRLGKQRVEALQLVHILTGKRTANGSSLLTRQDESAWDRHPAALMWRGHSWALCHYGLTICREWCARGYRDGVAARLQLLCGWHAEHDMCRTLPWWFGDESFHRSHRSNLLRKFPEHYSQLWPDEPTDLPYIWPR